jgi:hypothetical protein
MTANPVPSLPDLPPQVFASLQVLERALGDASMTRARHIEAEQALNNIAQFAIEANKKQRELAGQPTEQVQAAN